MIACKYHQMFMLSLCNILVHVYKSFEEKNKYQTAFHAGIKVKEHGPLLKDLFQTDYFRIVVCDDETTVEVCGALKV